MRIFLIVIGVVVSCYILFELVNLNNIYPQGDRTGQVLGTERNIRFAVLFMTNDTQSLNALEKGYVEDREQSFNDRNYVMQPIGLFMESDWVFDHFAHYRKMLLGPSLQSLREALAAEKDHSVDVISYDIEHWPKTPSQEKNNPIMSIMEGASMVHAHGHRYGITPDARYLLENYKVIDWKEIDFVALQFQRFSVHRQQFMEYTREVSSFINSVNPDTEIFVQVSFRYTNADQMIQIIEDSAKLVDGILIVYLPNINDPSVDACSPRCNPEALEKVLHRINTINEMS